MPRKSKTFNTAWRIYDDQRTALYNCKFFEAKIEKYQFGAMWLDIVIAIGTSTTGVAGWALWSQPTFSAIWVVIAGSAATLAVIKPILQLDGKLVKFTKLYGEYGRLSTEYINLVSDIGESQSITKDFVKRHAELRKAAGNIEMVPQTPKTLKQQVEKEVNEEWPITRYWSPTR